MDAAAAGSIAALLTAAAPIILAISKLIGKKPPVADESTLTNIAKEADEAKAKFQAGLKYEQENPIPETERDREGMPIWLIASIGAGVLALTIGIIYYARKK